MEILAFEVAIIACMWLKWREIIWSNISEIKDFGLHQRERQINPSFLLSNLRFVWAHDIQLNIPFTEIERNHRLDYNNSIISYLAKTIIETH